LPCGFRLRCRSAFNGVNRRKVTVVAPQRQSQRRFASIPVGGSIHYGAALKRSASRLDKQMILKLNGYKSEKCYICATKIGTGITCNPFWEKLSAVLKNMAQPVFQDCRGLLHPLQH
jgi:hypothetical protein